MLKSSKKILLVFPNPISEMPIGFAYIAGIFKQKGYKVRAVVNTFSHFLQWNDLVRLAKDYQPSIVGFNIGTFRLLGVYKTIRKMKDLGVTVIAGGAHVTTCAEEVIENGVDIAVRNEGEETISELCDFWEGKKDLSLDAIKGVSFKDSAGKIKHNPRREYIQDLKYLPAPDFTCFDQDVFRTSDGLLKGMHRIYCSRGCPACCTFCDRAIFGQKVRYRPIENVVNEIEERKNKYGIDCFVIADDTFTFSKKYVRDFCEAVKDRGLNIKWSCSTRANAVDAQTLDMMKKSGCYMVSYGIESGDEETLEIIRKNITLEQAHEAVNLAAAAGFRIYVNLMTGFPWEKESAVMNNIKYIKEHFNQVYVYQVSGAIVPYPGTEIYAAFKDEYRFEKWWLKEAYQNYGIQIYQNVENPYKYSTFYQRKLYDDTHIWEETFFKYSRKYKNRVKKMAFLIGKRNLISLYPSPVRRWIVYQVCKLSRLVYEVNPRIEKRVTSAIISAVNFKSRFHDRGPIGYASNRKINVLPASK